MVNTNPIFILTPNIGKAVWLSSTTANTKNDGTGTIGTDILLVFSAGSNGSWIEKLRFTPNASAAATAITPTVIRVYISTQNSGSTTNANTYRWDEITAPNPSGGADQATVGTPYLEIPCGFTLPTSNYILVSMHHAAAANTSWAITCVGGDY